MCTMNASPIVDSIVGITEVTSSNNNSKSRTNSVSGINITKLAYVDTNDKSGPHILPPSLLLLLLNKFQSRCSNSVDTNFDINSEADHIDPGCNMVNEVPY